MIIMNYEDYHSLCMKSPRLNATKDYFDKIGRFKIQKPKKPIEVDPVFLSECSPEMRQYWAIFKKTLGGGFNSHYFASSPFITEELVRLGVTLCQFYAWLSTSNEDMITHYEPSGIDGVNSRTMAEFSNGLVRTLTDSPDLFNKENFYQFLNHGYSKFRHGSLVDTTLDFLASHPDLSLFKEGFNTIHMSMALQAYTNERSTQIFYLKRLLKEKGLFILKEKLYIPDMERYGRYEKIKDEKFKSLYFTEEEINSKRADALDIGKGIGAGQIDFDTCVSVLKLHFKYVYLIWNSTNFYEFCASDDKLVIEKFINLLPPPFVPAVFRMQESLPVQF